MKPQPTNQPLLTSVTEPENDDLPVGRVWSRKEVFTLFGGAAGMALLAGCSGGSTTTPIATTATPTPSAATPTPSASASATPTPSASASATPTPTSLSCVATPQLTEGPYWVDEMLNRSDIRTDPTTSAAKAGTPLVMNLYVTNVNGACAPLSNLTVDIWHCDASGAYSDEAANNTSGQKFLRGYQTTDANGLVQFTTIYPGWYAGRSVHIHFRVRGTVGGKTFNFTSQLFFDDTLTDAVFASQSPYSSRGTRTTRNSNDNIYASQMLMSLVQSGTGYATTFVIGLSV